MLFGELLCVFIICFVVEDVISVVQPVRPDYEFSSQADGFLKLHRKPASWNEARLRCYYEAYRRLQHQRYQERIADPVKRKYVASAARGKTPALLPVHHFQELRRPYSPTETQPKSIEWGSAEQDEDEDLVVFLARLFCPGGVLASPLNQSLTVAMKVLIAKDRSPPPTIYTGIHSQFSYGDFVSVEGVPFYSMDLKWAPGEPHPYSEPKEDCILMNANGDIADVSCKSHFPYICYKKAPENGKPSICGTYDKDYKYDFRTGSCYKVHRMGRTWSRGFMTCQAEGGHMAIINSDAEAQVMKELLKEHPEDTMFADYKHVASIGYQDWGERGSWWTIHGQDLSEAGYAKWNEGSPDAKDSQFCGGINRNGKLNDIWCNNFTFPVICEVPITSLLDVRSLLLPENQQQ